MIQVKYLQDNLDCDVYITQEIDMGLPTVTRNIKDYVKINQDGLDKLNSYTVSDDDLSDETNINAYTDSNYMKDAKTLQDLTEEDRNLYYGEDILSDEAIENRIDICEEMQSKDKLSIKADCKEFVNTIDGVNIIAEYVIDRALND